MKKLIFCSAISAVVLVVCPVTCFKIFNDGILLLVLLILVQFAYPFLSLVCGIVSGLSIDKLYLLPFINSSMFMLSIWLIYDKFDYLVYMGINLSISLVIMCIVAYINKRVKEIRNFTNEAEV